MAMTATKDTDTTAGPLDTVLLVLAALVIVGALFAYYWFEQTPVALRAGGIIVGLGAAAALVYRTQLGQTLWQFIQGSRVEIRKVVWPTRQETQQTTLAVFVFLLVLGIFFWSLDLLLLWITRTLTGQGS
jgi:preprotein translocase subunit SecE